VVDESKSVTVTDVDGAKAYTFTRSYNEDVGFVVNVQGHRWRDRPVSLVDLKLAVDALEPEEVRGDE
jgi:hypothetical protein